MTEDIFDNFPELRDYPKESGLPAEPPTEMSGEFLRSTLLALKAQQEILGLQLDERDPNYKAKLAAKASLASQQITAQLKADENQLRSRMARVSYYEELKKALEEFRAGDEK